MKGKNILVKILDIIVDVIVGIVFFVSVGIVIANISAGKDGNPNLFGYSFYTVQTDSMKGTIEEGDLILGKLVSSDEELEVGDIITFKMSTNGKQFLNTHEIIDKVYTGSMYEYFTKGTNTPDQDPGYRILEDVVGEYTGFRIPGVGSFIDFVKEPLGFVLCLVMPLVLFIAYEVYKIVVSYMQNKKEEMLAEAKEQTSDEVKDAIIKEYLASQNKDSSDIKKSSSKKTSKED